MYIKCHSRKTFQSITPHKISIDDIFKMKFNQKQLQTQATAFILLKDLLENVCKAGKFNSLLVDMTIFWSKWQVFILEKVQKRI